jgi:hypothetical protein
MDGGRIPGGCDSCDAYQVPECVANNFWVIKVFHDDWCPLLQAREEAGPA